MPDTLVRFSFPPEPTVYVSPQWPITRLRVLSCSHYQAISSLYGNIANACWVLFENEVVRFSRIIAGDRTPKVRTWPSFLSFFFQVAKLLSRLDQSPDKQHNGSAPNRQPFVFSAIRKIIAAPPKIRLRGSSWPAFFGQLGSVHTPAILILILILLFRGVSNGLFVNSY